MNRTRWKLMIGALGLGLGGLAAVADVPPKGGVSCTPPPPKVARAAPEVPPVPTPDVVPAAATVPPLTLPPAPPPVAPSPPVKLPEMAAAPALPLIPPPAAVPTPGVPPVVPVDGPGSGLSGDSIMLSGPQSPVPKPTPVPEVVPLNTPTPTLPELSKPWVGTVPPPPVPTAAPVLAPAGTPLRLSVPVPADGGAGSFQRYEVTFKPPMLEAKPTLPPAPAKAVEGADYLIRFSAPIAPPPAVKLVEPVPPKPAFTEPPQPKPTTPAPTPAAAEKKLKVLLHMGDDRPKFEIRDGDEVYLKVASDKVDVKSPGDAGANMSTMRATGKVTFVTPGGEGTCSELVVVPGTGQVVVTGQVNFTYNWGKVETTVSGEKMTFRLGATPGVGPAVAAK